MHSSSTPHPTVVNGKKIHRNLVEAVIRCLHAIFHNKLNAEHVVDNMLKSNPKWGGRDRRFIAETTYDIVRQKSFFEAVSSSCSGNDLWKLVAAWCVGKNRILPDWLEFHSITTEVIQHRWNLNHSFVIKESIPAWLNQVGHHELGQQRWEQEMHALNQRARVCLRANTLKDTVLSIQKKIAQENIETYGSDQFPEALILTQRKNMLQTHGFKEGLVELQDVASQQVVPFTDVKPGMCCIDACAGGGGKTLHMASMMKNKGTIIALDTSEKKLRALTVRTQRAGATNITTQLIKSPDTITQWKNKADRLLLDVPCSGLGTLKRHPDIKWKLSPKHLEDLRVLQKKILLDYVSMLKIGGLAVYATCSILPSENEEQIKAFLKAKQGTFECMEEKISWPSDGFDGFYMARLKRISI